MAPNDPAENLTESLTALDADAFELADACKQFALHDPAQLSKSSVDVHTRARVREVARSFQERHATELELPGWHGPTSFQRMVWQDAEVLELLARPAALATVVLGSPCRTQRSLGTFTLGAALVSGIASNRPSYLFTASPNWAAIPAIPNKWTDHLDDMKPPTGARQEIPYLVSGAMLRAASTALTAMRELAGPAAEGRRRHVWALIGAADEARVMQVLAGILDAERVQKLVCNPQLPSTAIDRMCGQCLEVMRMLPGLLAATAGGLERAIGFGLVSHALDAKHLAAMLHQPNQPIRPVFTEPNFKGTKVFNGLVDDFRHRRMEERPRALLLARLRQTLQLIADHAEPLGVQLADLERHLAG